MNLSGVFLCVCFRWMRKLLDWLTSAFEWRRWESHFILRQNLTMEPQLALNSWSSYLNLLGAGITPVPLNQLKVFLWNNKSWSQIFIWPFRSWETCQWGFPKTVCDIVHKIKFCDIWLPGKNLVTQSIAQLFWEKGSSWKGNVSDSPSCLSSVKKGDYIVLQLWRGEESLRLRQRCSRVYWTRKAKPG